MMRPQFLPARQKCPLCPLLVKNRDVMDVMDIFLYDIYLILDDHLHGFKEMSILGRKKKDKCKYLTSNEWM